MLRVGNGSGLIPSPEAVRLPHGAPERPVARVEPAAQRANRPAYLLPGCDRSAAFQVQQLRAAGPDHAPPRPEVILAAYSVHLASRIRYLGPLTPVDLRV